MRIQQLYARALDLFASQYESEIVIMFNLVDFMRGGDVAHSRRQKVALGLILWATVSNLLQISLCTTSRPYRENSKYESLGHCDPSLKTDARMMIDDMPCICGMRQCVCCVTGEALTKLLLSQMNITAIPEVCRGYNCVW